MDGDCSHEIKTLSPWTRGLRPPEQLAKEQVSFNFMAAVTVHSDLEPKKIKAVTVSTFSPLFAIK